MPPRLQQDGGGEGHETENGELLEHLLQQLLHGQRRGNQWTLEKLKHLTRCRLVAWPLAPGVPSRPEPPVAPWGGAGAEMGHCQGRHFQPCCSSFLMCAPCLAWCTASSRCSEPYVKGGGVGARAKVFGLGLEVSGRAVALRAPFRRRW